VEEAESLLAENQEALSEIESNWTAEQTQLQERQSELNHKVADLAAQRPVLTGAIDQDDLDIYDNLYRRKAGRAVAAVKNGVCQACNLANSASQLQRARTGTELIYCSTCGRILYVL